MNNEFFAYLNNILLTYTFCFCFCFPIFLIYLLIMLLQLSHFHPFPQLHPAHPLPPNFPPYTSCPWVIQISSLASTFPTLLLPSPCLFSTYHLCYLFSVPSPLSPPPTPLLITLHWSLFLWFCFCSSCLLSFILFWF